MSMKRTLTKSVSILSALSVQDDLEMEEGVRPSSYLKIGDKVSLYGESETGVRGFVSTLGYVNCVCDVTIVGDAMYIVFVRVCIARVSFKGWVPWDFPPQTQVPLSPAPLKLC